MHILFSSFNTAHTARNCLKKNTVRRCGCFKCLTKSSKPEREHADYGQKCRSDTKTSDTLSSLVYRSSIWPALQTGLSTSRQRQLTHILRNYDSLVMCRLLNQCQSGVWSLPVPPTLCHGRTFPAQTFLIRHLRTGWSPDLGGYLLKTYRLATTWPMTPC